jgi:hypothetical protein
MYCYVFLCIYVPQLGHVHKRVPSDLQVTKVEEDALRSELDAHNRTLSPIYSMIIMQESDYHHTAQVSPTRARRVSCITKIK